jgi:hypothetical protein
MSIKAEPGNVPTTSIFTSLQLGFLSQQLFLDYQFEPWF